MMKSVGELKEFIKDLPDDMIVAKFKVDMETDGFRNEIHCEVKNMREEEKQAYDSFDGTKYNYKVLVSDSNGTPCLLIL